MTATALVGRGSTRAVGGVLGVLDAVGLAERVIPFSSGVLSFIPSRAPLVSAVESRICRSPPLQPRQSLSRRSAIREAVVEGAVA